MKTSEDIFKGLIVLSELFGKEISDSTMRVVVTTLETRMGADSACNAIHKWIETGRTFPSVADLISLSHPKKGNISAVVEEALNEMKAVIASGGNEKLIKSRLALHAWMELGCWPVIGQLPIDKAFSPKGYEDFCRTMKSTLYSVVERQKNGSIIDDKLCEYLSPYDGGLISSSSLLELDIGLN